MPRGPRVECCGYHHVYNRGVAKGIIFQDNNDKERFLKILDEVCRAYSFNIHSFCLMSNHYHLIVENLRENLSSGMRQINSQYASYFNKRHKRVGHLWQGRFKSWYVADENYLYTLFKYIEQNPVKANMSTRVGEYKYCSTYSIFRDAVPRFLLNSFVLRNYPTKDLFKSMQIPMSKQEQECIKNIENTKYIDISDDRVPIIQANLEDIITDYTDKKMRNKLILKAFNEGHTKSEIARKVKLSVTGVTKIIKSLK